MVDGKQIDPFINFSQLERVRRKRREKRKRERERVEENEITSSLVCVKENVCPLKKFSLH